jgi:hypothetical protein
MIYINHVPPTINTLSEPILFADDTSVIISSKNYDDSSATSNTVPPHVSKWFTSNKLVLYLDETNIITFIINKPPQYNLNIGLDETYTEESVNAKFLGLLTDNHFNWKYIDLVIPKLSRACYAIRSMFCISSTDTLKLISFAYFHSIMNYGMIFGVIPQA